MSFPDLHWTTILGMPSYVWAGVITPVVLALLVRSAQRPAKDVNGWRVLRPSFGLYVMSVIGFVMGCAFAASTVLWTMLLLRGKRDGLLVPLSIGSPVLALLGFYIVAHSLLIRVAFNDSGIEWSFLRSRIFIPWSEIHSIRQTIFSGPKIFFSSGKSVMVSAYFLGFQDLCSAASSHGITVRV